MYHCLVYYILHAYLFIVCYSHLFLILDGSNLVWSYFPIFLLMKAFFFLSPFSFSLMTGCPGDSDSWPCLHQVRSISFYFVFHQLWLHKTSLVSGDCCQKLQSPLLVGSFACFAPNPHYKLVHWQALDETRGQCSTQDGPDSATHGLYDLGRLLLPFWVSISHL